MCHSSYIFLRSGRVQSMILRMLVAVTVTLSAHYIFLDVILLIGTSLLSSLIWISSDDLFSGPVPISFIFCFHSSGIALMIELYDI